MSMNYLLTKAAGRQAQHGSLAALLPALLNSTFSDRL